MGHHPHRRQNRVLPVALLLGCAYGVGVLRGGREGPRRRFLDVPTLACPSEWALEQTPPGMELLRLEVVRGSRPVRWVAVYGER